MSPGRPNEDTPERFIDAVTEHGANEASAETFREAVRDVAARVSETKRIAARQRKPRRWPR